MTPESLLPVLLALGAACMFGVSSVVAKRGLAHIDAQTGALISIGTVVVLYLLIAPFWMRAADWFTLGFWVFVLNGFIHPMLSMYMALEATDRIGPTVAATFSSTAPLFAALTAVLFLDEVLKPLVAAGTLGTVGGLMLLSWSRRGIPKLVQAALLFATGAAVIRGINHTVGKWGLELLPNVFMASFISFLVSFIGSVVLFQLRHGHLPRQVPHHGLAHFVLSGFLIALAIGCMYGGLSLGRVVVVSPIVAAYPVFTLLGSLALREELLTPRLLAGVAIVVAGVTLISLGSA